MFVHSYTLYNAKYLVCIFELLYIPLFLLAIESVASAQLCPTIRKVFWCDCGTLRIIQYPWLPPFPPSPRKQHPQLAVTINCIFTPHQAKQQYKPTSIYLALVESTWFSKLHVSNLHSTDTLSTNLSVGGGKRLNFRSLITRFESVPAREHLFRE